MGPESFPESLGDVVRLFPLPNLVLFPHALQPLHIFEPRYIEMTEDALAGDGLITLVLLQPGWEANYWDRPAIYDVACVGRIRWHERLANGRFNLLLQGLCRFQIESELDVATSYRQAKGWPMPDLEINTDQMLKRELLQQVHQRLGLDHPLRELLPSLHEVLVPLGAVCDILAFSLPLELRVKQHLLGTFDVEERAHHLIRAVRQIGSLEVLPMPREVRPFPPLFSPN